MKTKAVKNKALVVARRLLKAYPDSDCSLPQESTFKLLVAVILSAQCTDERVKKTVPGLFAQAPDPWALSELPLPQIKKLIASVGLTQMKSKNLKGMAKILVEKYEGQVPQTREELMALPGVGRKTANVMLGVAFKIPALVVDTHVTRISNLLGLTQSQNPLVIEQDLCRQLPKKYWTQWAHLLIDHGRAVCIARRPQCGSCVLANVCPSVNR